MLLLAVRTDPGRPLEQALTISGDVILLPL